MEAAIHCRECETELVEESPTGLCEVCERKSSAGENPAPPEASPSTSQMQTLKSRPRHETPTPESIARHFPQLEIIEQLGQGGMGVVFKARQKGLDRLVALKIPPLEASEQAGFSERFTREGRALAKLNHPNIVSVFDSGEVDGLYYFIMEFVDGPNLRQVIVGGESTPEHALNIVSQVCEGLQFAHDEGIVHRDIKPENILLDLKGRAKIADFGVAKLLDRKPSEIMLTSADQIMGTPHYMAPEQTERPLEVDHRADIYSVGVVFYELLTGELPLGRFPLPSEKVGTDVRLDEIVLQTLAKEPERRYQQATELKAAVDSLAGTQLNQTKYQMASPTPPMIPTPGAGVVSTTSPTIVTPRPAQMSSLHVEVDFELAYAKVRTPANLMYSMGVICFVISGMWAVAQFIIFVATQSTDEALATAIGSALFAVGAFFIMIGAQRMKRLESYRMAQTAAILCLTPVTLACWMPFSILIGIWALKRLNRRDIVAAFEVKAEQRQAKTAQTQPVDHQT